MVIGLVNQFGPKRWDGIASHLKGRIGKQCRERYTQPYRPLVGPMYSQLGRAVPQAAPLLPSALVILG